MSECVRLSPEEAQDLVEEHGDGAAAARAIGVDKSIFWSWRYHERDRARKRRYYLANRGSELARRRRKYAEMSGFERNRELLRVRRVKALIRKREREARVG